MTHTKSTPGTVVLGMMILLVCSSIGLAATGVAPQHTRASQALQSSRGTRAASTENTPKPVDQELDTLFAKTKADFDKMAASPVLKSPKTATVNAFFLQSLKAYLPWHSLLRTDKKGQVIDEVIRIEGVSKEKRSVADQPWFVQVSKTMKEQNGLAITEKTGRYYLVWSAPFVSKVKGTDVFQGAVSAQIDLWDCFDQFSNKATTPFMIRILGRVTLFNHLWTDTLKYVERPLTVPGLDKIVVRFPAMTKDLAAEARADSIAREQVRLDSLRVKAATDSVAKAAIAAKAQKVRSRQIAIIVEVAIGLLILIIGIVLLARSRRQKLEGGSGKSRFDNL